ncbi:MAG: hypothetical protein AB7N76_05600 [Planctomycetota bacterium]
MDDHDHDHDHDHDYEHGSRCIEQAIGAAMRAARAVGLVAGLP